MDWWPPIEVRWYVGLIGCDLSDRDQRQADIAHFLEQAMECRLVGDKTMNRGGAVALMGKAESVKAGGPSGIQVSLEADFNRPGF